MKVIIRAGFKIEPCVERSRFLVDGMNKDCANPQDVRSLFHPRQGIFQQRPAEARPLFCFVNS